MGNTVGIINILYLGNKVIHLNTLEKYYIYLETKRNNQIRAKSTVNENCNFDTTVKNDLTKGQHLGTAQYLLYVNELSSSS
jgi:hypothetical protein